MKIKPSSSVCFLKSFSLEEELAFINQPTEQKSKVNKNKLFGKNLQLSNAQLIKPYVIDYRDLYYSLENQDFVFLVLMLLSAHPFANFLCNFKEKILDLREYPLFSKLINLLEIKDTRYIDGLVPFEGCTDIKQGYSFILKCLHQELISNFHFEEDAWNVQKKSKQHKIIYSEYSPIVEIFQGKLQEEVGEVKAGSFEIIKDLEILTSNNCKKKPYVILKEGSPSSKKIEGYNISSFLTEDRKLVIFANNKVYEYYSKGFNELDYNEEVFSNYKNVIYTLYSKII